MPTQPKRTRTVQTSFRLTQEEKQRWDDACAASGLTQQQLLMRLLDGHLVVVPSLKDTLIELHYQGINLNQVVKKVHQCAPNVEGELRDTARKCQTVYTGLERYLNQIYEVEEKQRCQL